MYTFKDKSLSPMSPGHSPHRHDHSHSHSHDDSLSLQADVGDEHKKKGHIGADGRHHSHDSHLTSGFDLELLQVGEPGYQTYRCLDYFFQFNNSND